MDARSVWRSINRQQKREEVAGALSRAHYRLNRRLQDEGKRLNEKGLRLFKRASYSLLVDSLDVQRDGTTPIREYLR